jgi:hypothetical protein
MRIIFMGTAPFAGPTLHTLLASPHQIVAVVTQPDRPRGRGQKATASAVKTLALERHVTTVQPASLRPAAVLDTLASYRPEIIVVVAYGNILPPAVLKLPPHGCIMYMLLCSPNTVGPPRCIGLSSVGKRLQVVPLSRWMSILTQGQCSGVKRATSPRKTTR